MMNADKVELSGRSKQLLEELVEAAKDWGWVSDQGHGNRVDRSRDQFVKAEAAMEQQLHRLEQANRKLRRLLKEANG